MVTTEAFDPHPDRTRWLRRSAAAAIATVVLGVGGTGLAVGILSARQPDTSGGTQASTSSTDDSSNGSESSGDSSSDSDGSGLGSAQQDAPTQGGTHGS
jgi:hypothetical protein